MANNYVQFSAELVLDSLEEQEWLKQQLEDVEVATLTDHADTEDRPRFYIVPPDADGCREGYDLPARSRGFWRHARPGCRL
jgi:hypothetical protein